MNILVVEDNHADAQALKSLLMSGGYGVDWVSDERTGMQLAQSAGYSLLLLGGQSAQLDGIRLCQAMRARGIQTPIFLLIERNTKGKLQENSYAIALNAGADDYLAKPFDVDELVARVAALVQREQTGSPHPAVLPEHHESNPQQETETAYQLLEQEREELKRSYDELAHQYAERTADLSAANVDLQQSEAKNQAVIAALPDLMIRVGSDGCYREVIAPSGNFEVLAIDAIGKSMADVLPDDLAERAYFYLQQALQTGELQVFEQQIQLGDRLQHEEVRVIKSSDDEGMFIIRDITEAKQAEFALQKQVRQEYLLANITQEVQRTLNLNDVLSSTVHRVREFLDTDRVIIFRFRPDWTGEVVMESVGAEWTPILSTNLFDPCFGDRYVEPYRQGRFSAVADITQAGLQPCHLELLQQFQVNANLVVPILQGDTLWGLLIAHHCAAPRQWEPAEIVVLRRLAVTVGIAIQQSELYEQCQRELAIRQQAEADLAQSEKTLRAIFDSTFEYMGLLSRDGIVLDANRTALDAIAADLADVVGLPFWDTPWWAHSPQHQQQQLQEAIARAAKGDCVRFETTHRRADGAEIIVDFSIKPIVDNAGNVIMLVPEGRDISERKAATQKIEQQAALLDIASDAIFVRDLENRILYWNRGAERLYGWQAAEAIGQYADELLQNPDTSIVAVMQRLAETGEWQGELRKVTKTGKRVTIETRWTLVRDESGQPQSILSVDTDITEKKLLEAQFYQAQRLESVGQLASGIAHDLNNVFTPILTMAQLLRMGLNPLDSDMLERTQLIEDSARRGAHMVQQILTFSRGTASDPVPTDIPALLHEAIAILRQSFPRAITLRHDVSPTLVQNQVLADPTQLHQVVMNLCMNARDAMHDGGVLAIAAENIALDDETATHLHPDAHAGNYVVITVSDTGTGIPPEVCDRIFDPFFTTKDIGKGTGLGLSSVLGIVKGCGGFVHLQTEVGQGTTFRVYLPALDPSSAHPGVKTTSPENQIFGTEDGNTPQTTILIVDDDPLVQRTTQTLLNSHHYNTLVANDSIAALERYNQQQNTIQLVILDIMMPTMDGVELIRKLKAINPRVNVLAISGVPTNRSSALDAGATAFMTKPYDLEEFVHVISVLLS